MTLFLKWFFGIAFIVVLLLVLAIALAPAQLVVIAAERFAPQVSVSEPSGTLWQGQLNQVDIRINNTNLALGAVSWSISPLALLRETFLIDLTVKASAHNAKLRAAVTRDLVVTVDKMEGMFPLSLLEPWVPLLIKGDVAFVVDHIVLTQSEILAIDGVINLQQADWLGGGTESPLGSYIAQVSMNDTNDVLVQLNDFSATLGIDGLITIGQSGNYQFDSVLEARDGLAPDVAQSILWLGTKNDYGEIVVNHSGRWQ